MTSARQYTLHPGAVRDLRRLDAVMRQRVFRALDRLVAEPPRGDVKKLQGSEDEWRLRVGDWRIRFTRDGATGDVLVLSIEPRGRAYRD
ncbi:MAG: type II toxin-antitoxin system RelE/ParE family toxin [Chloroflexota bacterium]|nr:type II toxin-antitoxin system RelE/ParE family toxin [Chloroflexota bacterium]